MYWAATGPGSGFGFGAIWEANLDGTGAHSIIPSLDSPTGVAADASQLYWTDGGNGTINEANLDGTNAHTVVPGQKVPVGVAVTPLSS